MARRLHAWYTAGMSGTSATTEALAELQRRIERLNAIGAALSAESTPEALLELILLGAKELTRADGGTVYRVEPDGSLAFVLVRNDSLGFAMGGSGGSPVTLPPIPLRLPDGEVNHASVVAHCVLAGTTVNIADAYHVQGFDFTGTRAFDLRTGYRSVSFLTVPMRDHEGVITGVIQLINARDTGGKVVPFAPDDQRLVESLASQAATAVSKHHLIEGQKALFEAFIKLIATAIDEKSPYTGGHCRRVPELTMRLAEAAVAWQRGALAGFAMTPADRYELHIASWLHDCGKITTPEWVMDKATKLARIYDRIDLIATRFALAKAQARAACLESILAGADRAIATADCSGCCARLDEDLAFLRRVNTGSEKMREEDQVRVRAIASRTMLAEDGSPRPLLSDDEVRNLCIAKGTLLPEERDIINQHITATIRMLESLPYPRHLRRVPEFAGGHHERMDGKGYPRGLTRERMSIQARIMGIADVFEALTAGDRPYKQAMKLSQALTILGRMKLEGHIDPDLFDAFIHSGLWREYAAKYLPPEQRDEVDLRTIPGV